MKHWLKWFGYVVLVSQVFSMNLPVLSTLIAGYSVKYILYYLFIGIVNIKWWIKSIRQKTVKLWDFAVMLIGIGPFIVGLVWGWPLNAIFVEAVLLIMPLTIFQWVALVNIRRREFVDLLCWTTIAACVVSVLVALRIIQTNIWAAANDLVRSAGAIDSTLGIGGFGIALVLLYIYPSGISQKQKWLLRVTLVASAVLLVFSQSRTRITLMLLLAIVAIVYNIFNRHSGWRTTRMILLGIITLVAAMSLFPEVFSQIMDQVATRFMTTSSLEVNVSYRNTESMQQLGCFLKSPILGMGWGCRSQFDSMYVHNLYTALLMHGGILFGGLYIVWFLAYLFRSIKRLAKKKNMQNSMISCCFMLSLAILAMTNGGIAQSGGYVMMIFPFIDEKLRKEKGIN